ncbi:MAG: GNAT family N-acetyltransferase [Actinobacteria bacterium]|nr:GNAT family N-acetyltransferase [Actinomycetota bacterium]MCL6087823.1 GNAT family N-acetyltransferase [Actinomycetota bacterium]
MSNIIIKEIKDFNLDFVLEIKQLEIENLGEASGINEWIIPVIIKYGKLIVAVKKDDFMQKSSRELIIGVNELIRDWNDFSRAFIHSFYIKEGFRNKGTGSLLLGESIKILKRDKIKKIELTVDPQNISAIRFYEKFGFKLLEFKKNMYGKDINRNIMLCNI